MFLNEQIEIGLCKVRWLTATGGFKAENKCKVLEYLESIDISDGEAPPDELYGLPVQL